jgi:uncharacterized membrane-anchored protein
LFASSIVILALLGAMPVLASPPPEADPPADAGTPPEAAPDGVAPDGAAPEQAEAEAEPLPAWMIEQDPAAAARLAALDEQGFQALIERADKPGALSADDEAVLALVVGQMEREFDAELDFQTGDVDISKGLATIHLSDEYRFLGPEDARKVLVEGWDNPPDTAKGVLGMIFPADMRTLQDGSWGVILTFSADGYVEDDDADDLDYDELLESLKEGSAEENRQRTAAGYPALHLKGWAEPPHYDEDKRALYWALRYESEGASDDTLNFAIRVLGRRGVLELNGVAGMSQLDMIKPAMEDVYAMVEYNPGHRYEDFDPDIDKIAAYGIGGLILGKVAMKTGLIAGLIKLLIAGKKLLIVGAIALVAFFKHLLGRKNEGADS